MTDPEPIRVCRVFPSESCKPWLPTDQHRWEGKIFRFNGTPIEDWDPTILFDGTGDDPESGPPSGDCSAVYMSGCLFFTEKAVEALRTELESSGELLPVRTPLGIGYLLNVTDVVNALDYERSKLDLDLKARREGKTVVESVREYEFISDRIEGKTLFKLAEFPVTPTYATGAFARAYQRHGLTGLDFHVIWPRASREEMAEKWINKHQRKQRRK